MQAFEFLIKTVFDLYLMVVLLRVWLQLVRADFYNPFSQFVVKATNPLVVPLRRIIPGFAGVDWAAVVIALLVVATKWAILMLMTGGINVPTLAMLAVVNMFKEAGMMLFWVLLLRAILSWVSQGRSPVEHVLGQLTEPLLAPIRKVLPSLGGLDLSVLVLFIGLNFLNILLGGWIPYWQML